ncbi:MAG: helix-turn-helix transcriptional regulator [Clostridia bacterium]|nr:helix-turn-helix transcriptional regulator [Clostridia bacterium]
MVVKEPKLISAGRFTSRGNWIHPERKIDTTELMIVVDGAFDMVEDGEIFRLSSGSVLILDEGLEHRGAEITSERVCFYWFHLKNFSNWNEKELKKQIQLSDPYAVTLLCRQILFYLKGNYPHDVSEHLLQVLLAEIVAQGRESELSTEALAVRIREWIRINTDQPLTVSQIANRFGYNEDYLSRLFKKNYGKSLKGVIDEMKAAQIKRLLLESDMTLYEIARRMSFEDYKLFLKFFKYHEGITPTEFRNLYCDIHTNNH